ncbi:hypothetical protein O0L34_g10097 [Tuta absoluta]|nr:hypothetical protein O0L34_g10097 [Tuta absoluta]
MEPPKKKKRGLWTENQLKAAIQAVRNRQMTQRKAAAVYSIPRRKYKSPGKCLLIFDGASSHLDARIVDEADKNNIVLYCLPSNTTHELQPLDKSVNKSFEHYWDEEVLLYAYQNPERKITKTRFGKIFTKVWSRCMTQSNIINGFRATGLYPYDPSVIPDQAYAPSVLTEIPDPQLHNVSNNSIISATAKRDKTPDSDATDYEDNFQNVSPSVLNQNEELQENYTVFDKTTQLSMQVASKLVDYSSSSESAMEQTFELEDRQCKTPVNDLISRNSAIKSPMPSTSGTNMQFRPRLNSPLSDSSLSEDIEPAIQKYFQYPARNNNIYNSSSETEAEDQNLNDLPTRHERDNSNSNNSDDIPLSKIKKSAEPSVTDARTPFQKQIPTPNYANIKSKPRRKALNYIGQKITKDLFSTVKDKKNEKLEKNKQVISDIGKDQAEGKRTKNTFHKNTKAKKLEKEKNVKKVCNETNHKKKKIISKTKKTKKGEIQDKRKTSSIVISKDIKTKKTKNASWYCQACNEERISDMRQCQKCKTWYHEECVGLTKEDVEQFLCPGCT